MDGHLITFPYFAKRLEFLIKILLSILLGICNFRFFFSLELILILV